MLFMTNFPSELTGLKNFPESIQKMSMFGIRPKKNLFRVALILDISEFKVIKTQSSCGFGPTIFNNSRLNAAISVGVFDILLVRTI